MRRLAPALAAVILAATGPLAGLAHAQPAVVDISKGVNAQVSLAVPPFGGTSDLGARIAEVVSKDLDRSGYFHVLAGGYPEQNLNIAVQPQFAAWRGANVQDLVQGQVSTDADGRLRVDFRLWDTAVGTQLAGTQFTSSPDNWRRVAHKIADAAYTRLTGNGPYFDTRIVFVAESGPRSRRVKRLAIMDQDGANPSYLTNGTYTVLNPRFSPAGQEITYAVLTKDAARVYLFNIDTGRRETVGAFSGMAFAPRFTPDGQKVVLSVGAGRQHRYLRRRPALSHLAPADRRSGHRHLAVGVAGRLAHRLHLRPGRQAAALRDERGRRGSAPHQLRRRPVHRPGVEPQGRPDRRGGADRRPVPHRGDGPVWLWPARPDLQFLGRRPHLGAEWPRSDVLPGNAGIGTASVDHRRGRPQRTARALFQRCNRSGVVAVAEVKSWPGRRSSVSGRPY